MIKRVWLISILVIASFQIQAQDTLQSNFSLNADLVSRYVWRGQLLSAAPNIQPYASISAGQFTFGTWGSYAIGEKYEEINFYISWEYQNFGFSVNDYCTISDISEESTYFNTKKLTTPHSLEGTFTFKLSERFPLKLTAATFFYGNDLNESGENFNSSYIELAYPISKRDYDFNFFAGGTPAEGLYGSKAGLVNVGMSASKMLKFSENFGIPASVQLSANPLAENMYLVFSLTL